MARRFCLVTLALLPLAALGDDDDIYTFIQADRLEYAESGEELVWDLQGWVGDDYRKLWAKSEGKHVDGRIEKAEIQLLYGRAWTAFFDWQAGIRHETDPGPSRNSLVLGIQGLAPQWFEIDAAMFLDDDGDLSARLEAEYDLLLTQRLVFQPRFEVEMAADGKPEAGTGSGLVSTELGVRIRYEFSRKFAPYVGVNWTKLYGETADIATAAGQTDSDTSGIIGVRLWY